MNLFAYFCVGFRIFGLDNFLIHSPTAQDQPCPPRRFAAKAAGRGGKSKGQASDNI